MPGPENPPRVAEPRAVYAPVAAARATRQLEQSGFNRRQAEAAVLAVRELGGDLAAREDLVATKSKLKAGITHLDGEIAAIAIKTTRAKEDLIQMQIQQAKDAHRNTLWLAGTTLGGMAIATAVILAAMKLA
ncbi:MAG: hypothetical protein OXU31_03245 [Gammaproteobacteria bacterium]|nr:hypothetical protein [Gammaproteobacteria bacterium]